MIRKQTILFLFSDTGGGHRSAAEAIIEAIHLEFPDRFETLMVDVFREYAPLPLNYAPDIYPVLSRHPGVWHLGYRMSDDPKRLSSFYQMIWPYLRRGIKRLIRENQVDLIVSVHQLVNIPILRKRSSDVKRFVTVVTDLVSTHSAWYHPGADLVIVPTQSALKKAMKSNLSASKIKVIGQPVAEKFRSESEPKEELRKKLGWQSEILTVLLVGGGEGMGNLEQMALAINREKLPIQLVMVAGRNQALKMKLESIFWTLPVHIYGFVKEMPDFMKAADVLLTKAGPGTICEGFIAGLPLLLYSKMPGQEDGNVDYVVDHGAGYWTPTTDEMIKHLKNWINDSEELSSVAQQSRKLARPDASREIARELANQIQLSDIQQNN